MTTQANATGLEHLKAIGVNVNMIIRKKTLYDALKVAATFTPPYLVVMGDDGMHWVMSAKDAGKCRKAGYEVI